MAKRKTIGENPLDALLTPPESGEQSVANSDFNPDEIATLHQVAAWWRASSMQQTDGVLPDDNSLVDSLLKALQARAKSQGLTLSQALSAAIVHYLAK